MHTTCELLSTSLSSSVSNLDDFDDMSLGSNNTNTNKSPGIFNKSKSNRNDKDLKEYNYTLMPSKLDDVTRR